MSWIVFSASAVIVLAVVAVVRLRRRMVVVTIEGSSMWPLFSTGDRVLVRRTPLRAVQREQVVVIELPAVGPFRDEPSGTNTKWRRWMIKRAAAVPGDAVPAEFLLTVGTEPGSVVPVGKLLVLGDNLSNSIDSRTFGYIAEERVLGVALRRIRSRDQRHPPYNSRYSTYRCERSRH